MRGLSKKFISDLKEGILKEALTSVRRDDTLCLEIRENYINIYYRGGNILRLEEKDTAYTAWFDQNYCTYNNVQIPNPPTSITSEVDTSKWLEAIPLLKYHMDLWFSNYRKLEREYQQLVLKENNSLTNTDYFICDIEYSNENGRFDMLAVRWDSTSACRKNNKNLRLCLIEMKYGDSAMTGSSGILGHIESINSYLNRGVLESLKSEMINVFNIKLELGIINAPKPIINFSDEKPELIFLIANHDPSSKILLSELIKVKENDLFDIRFSFSNFMGYGLYAPNMKSLEETISLLKMQK